MSNAAHERLRRLLLLVPYVRQHPGIGVDALAKALGLSREELVADLDLLTLVGRPPFQPDDFLDVHVENDRVYVDLDQRFSKPPRLTPAEAAALAAAAALFRPAAGDALQRALQKLERVLPAQAAERYREMGQKIDAAAEGPPELLSLTRAAVEKREVHFDYFSHGRGETERRSVQPYELFSHRGQWYLQGFCLTRNDVRLFRLDRMARLEVTETRFASRAVEGGRIPHPGREGTREVRVKLSPSAAAYVRERFPAEPRADGGVEVRVAGDSVRWLTQWVLSFGGEAEVLEPAWAREAVAQAARGSLSS